MAKKRKSSKALLIIMIILLFMVIGAGAYYFFIIKNKETLTPMYLASENLAVEVLNEENEKVELVRGKEVQLSNKAKTIDDVEYTKFYFNDVPYYTNEDILVNDIFDVVKEKTLYVERTSSIYEDDESSLINGVVFKGERIDVIGHSKVLDDGSVERYQFEKGYVLEKYLTKDEEVANAYPEYAKYHEDIYTYDNGTGAYGMDYYPNDKPSFPDNSMPDIVRGMYINKEALYELDDYIELAKSENINTLIIDIRDNFVISAKLDAFKKYTNTAYEAGLFEKDEFRKMIQKVKDAGLYVIARITAFQDTNYAIDNPENCILDLSEGGKPLVYGDATWPTAYSRDMWEYNIELSKECIADLGFNEIQFDYVRFPEQVDYYADKKGILDLQNTYNESRAEAIQRFLMYAADEIHKVHGYVSACVFGETSSNYVAAYGQYWPAISNVVDVISPMPYPDHFKEHDYGINDVYVWQAPYRLVYAWASEAKQRQSETSTPAKVRSWIQGYNSIRKPTVIYDADKIAEQIKALKDADMYDGFMCWNVLSDYEKLKSFKQAFDES